jgi:hypothetical protein
MTAFLPTQTFPKLDPFRESDSPAMSAIATRLPESCRSAFLPNPDIPEIRSWVRKPDRPLVAVKPDLSLPDCGRWLAVATSAYDERQRTSRA